MRLGLWWPLEPSFNFYRQVRGLTWLEPLERRDPDGDYDYFVLIRIPEHQALLVRRDLHVLYRGPLSNTMLAAPAGRSEPGIRGGGGSADRPESASDTARTR